MDQAVHTASWIAYVYELSIRIEFIWLLDTDMNEPLGIKFLGSDENNRNYGWTWFFVERMISRIY